MSLVGLNTIADSGALINITALAAKSVYSNAVDFNFTLDEVKRADQLLITVYNNAIRYRLSDDDATPTIGHSVSSGTTFVISGKTAIKKLTMISSTGTADVFVTLLTFGAPN
jgi:hypothetical protein